jgi:hypothetical protein
MDETFAIVVQFMSMQGTWSKGYTYKHTKALEAGTIVVVPQKGFFGIGRVIKSEADYNFVANINYKYIHCIVPKP